METEQFSIQYEFRFENSEVLQFDLQLDKESVSLQKPCEENKPEWTRLSHNQCAGCPLSEADVPHCPVAVNLAELVEEFKTRLSTEACLVTCKTLERTYSKQTTLQEGLFSIMGVIMATSHCPAMNVFKPLARFHLPFSTIDETLIRMAATYCLGQYFEYKDGRSMDLDLSKLTQSYQKVQAVNEGILSRIKHLTIKDADRNALVILNSLAQLVTFELEGGLDSLRYLFPEAQPKRDISS
jgi:hypothetical protein